MLYNLALRIAAKLLVKTGLCRFLTIQRDGYKVRFHRSSFSAGLWVHPEYGLRDEEFLVRYLRASDTYVDIGANIGNLSLTAAQKAERVIAIEAHPRTFEFLKSNVELNRAGVELHNVAMGESPGTLCFSDMADDDQNHVSAAGIEVPVRTLDSLAIPHIHLLKVDVEGFERFVFLGGRETLQHTDCVYFESFYLQYARFKCGSDQVYQPLWDSGFTIYKLTDGYLHRIPADYGSKVCENLIAIRNLEDFTRRTGYSEGRAGSRSAAASTAPMIDRGASPSPI